MWKSPVCKSSHQKLLKRLLKMAMRWHPCLEASSYSCANQLSAVLTQSPASLWSIKILDSYVRNHLTLPISCIYLRSFELLEPTMLRLKCLVFWLQGIFKKRALSLEFASWVWEPEFSTNPDAFFRSVKVVDQKLQWYNLSFSDSGWKVLKLCTLCFFPETWKLPAFYKLKKKDNAGIIVERINWSCTYRVNTNYFIS